MRPIITSHHKVSTPPFSFLVVLFQHPILPSAAFLSFNLIFPRLIT